MKKVKQPAKTQTALACEAVAAVVGKLAKERGADFVEKFNRAMHHIGHLEGEAMKAIHGGDEWKHPAHYYARLLRGRISSSDAKPGSHKAKRLAELEAGFADAALKAVQTGDSDFFKRVAAALDKNTKDFAANPTGLAVIDAYAEFIERTGRCPTAGELVAPIKSAGVTTEARTIRSVCDARGLALSRK